MGVESERPTDWLLGITTIPKSNYEVTTMMFQSAFQMLVAKLIGGVGVEGEIEWNGVNNHESKGHTHYE